MARVFLSYRRADGPYAVGWLAERLRRLDEVTEVDTAFYDTELRAGDPFPTALDSAVAECDVLVAVIGPAWRGRRDDGSLRLAEPDDWVAREIGAAMSAGVVVLPVLVAGAEPLTEASLPPTLGALADVHALRFDRADDLETIVEHLRSHLDDIDRRRAAEQGLQEPVVLPSPWPSAPVWVAAAVAAVGSAVAGWLLFDWFGAESDADAATLDGWSAATAVLWAVTAGAGVLGVHHLRLLAHGGVRIRWRPVLLAALGAAVLLAWTGLQPNPQTDGRIEVGQWVGSVVAVALVSPWAVILAGSAWTTSTLDERDLGGRARLLGVLARASLIAGGVLAVCAVPGIVTTALAGAVVDRSGFGEQLRVIGQGALFTGMFAVLLVWTRTRLERSSIELDRALADLPPVYRRHGEAVLVTEPLDRRARWIGLVLVLPLLAGVVASLAISA